jgi:hypothetical protein
MLPFLLPSSITWSVTAGPSCRELEAQVAVEARRACAAAGTCEIALDARAADGEVLLTCDQSGLTLEARKGDRALWSLTVHGDAADRARAAGVWIARSERPPADGAPEPAPTADVLANPDRAAPASPKKTFAVSASLSASSFPLRAGEQEALALKDAYGVQLGAMVRVRDDVYVGPVLALERGTFQQERPYGGGVLDSHSATIARLAARIGWGALSSLRVFGGYVDVGGARGWWPLEDRNVGDTFVYASPTVFAQLPRGDLRPFLAVGGDVVLDFNRSVTSFGLHASAGAAWSAF